MKYMSYIPKLITGALSNAKVQQCDFGVGSLKKRGLGIMRDFSIINVVQQHSYKGVNKLKAIPPLRLYSLPVYSLLHLAVIRKSSRKYGVYLIKAAVDIRSSCYGE